MLCQLCLVEAPTRRITFFQNIGALVMRFHRSVDAELCKSCIHRHFWKMSGITFFLGWWGVISMIVTPFFLLNNIVRYLGCLPMAAVPAAARRAELDAAVIAKLDPHVPEIVGRLGAEEKLADIAADVAQKTGTSAGQIVLYMRALAAAAQKEQA